MKVFQKPLPSNSLIISSLSRNDYVDVFAVRLKTMEPIPIEKIPIIFFHAMPKWFGVLMKIRETIARWIGLKTAHGVNIEKQLGNFTGQVGQSIGLFHVIGRTANEILAGEDDSHLNFRISYLADQPDCLGREGAEKEKNGYNNEITIATTVQFNNWVGRIYFLPVKPIHRLIVPIILKRMARIIQNNQHKLVML